MDTTWNELSAAIIKDLSAPRLRRLLEQIIGRAFSILTRGSRRELQGLARKADTFARMCAPPADDKHSLRSWYGGQIQMLAALCRLGLAAEISTDVMRIIRSRAHAQRVLSALRHRETNMKTLADELDVVRQRGDRHHEHDRKSKPHHRSSIASPGGSAMSTTPRSRNGAADQVLFVASKTSIGALIGCTTARDRVSFL